MTKPTNIEITDNIGKLDQIKSEIIANEDIAQAGKQTAIQ